MPRHSRPVRGAPGVRRDHGLRAHGYLPTGEGREGISHPMMAERYALPGPDRRRHRLAHAPQRRAGQPRLRRGHDRDGQRHGHRSWCGSRFPQSLRIELVGSSRAGVRRKDVVLLLLAAAVESGPAPASARCSSSPDRPIAQLSTDERATLTNMTAELGGFTGIVAPDDETVRFLRERRGIDFALEALDAQRRRARRTQTPSASTARTLAPMVARSRRSRQRRAGRRSSRSVPSSTSLTAARARRASARTSTPITKCLPGPPSAACACAPTSSCTSSSARWTCATTASRRGTSTVFERVGAEMLQPVLRRLRQRRAGHVGARGRSDRQRHQPQLPRPLRPGKGLAREPATVAASAIAGRLASFEELRTQQ